MEALGQLAGSIAHDFNNMLTVITGYSELVLASMGADEPLYQDIKAIRRFARRDSDRPVAYFQPHPGIAIPGSVYQCRGRQNAGVAATSHQ